MSMNSIASYSIDKFNTVAVSLSTRFNIACTIFRLREQYASESCGRILRTINVIKSWA